MFQNQNLSRRLPLVFSDSRLQNKPYYHFRRSLQGKESLDLAESLQFLQRSQKNQVKGSNGKKFSFQQGFKRKYYSVCSQVLKMKKQWQDVKLRNLAYFSKEKKSGSYLLKRFYPTAPIKIKSKYEKPIIIKTIQSKEDLGVQNNIKKTILSKKIVLFKKQGKSIANKTVQISHKKSRNTVCHFQNYRQSREEIVKDLKPWPWYQYEQQDKMIYIK